MRVLITGADGFIGKNLQLHLAERNDVNVTRFTRSDCISGLPELLREIDCVFHLAGVNRPRDDIEFESGNVNLTRALTEAISTCVDSTGKKPSVIYTSSIQAEGSSPYGKSKRNAEQLLQALAYSHQVPVHVFRLPNVFGKWCKPNYNSVVATFCHNIALGLPIHIRDESATLNLLYVDDLVTHLLKVMDGEVVVDPCHFDVLAPHYTATVGALARQIQAFKQSRTTLTTEPVGVGLQRALYATYISYLPAEAFSYPIPRYEDSRGVFVEFLKTSNAGQVSFLTVNPGITRGGHYHHSKTEKFLVVQGRARFKFRHMLTNVTHVLETAGEKPEVVETVPGWAHDITNVGTKEMIVMLWANEVFDRIRPDTFSSPL
ncbi:MAG: capsular biosynthesis protein [Burkholderiales bacterium PBB4]|nr:MAG: capsular biosynthesis protein [Burkholderiales bacterium PBB4]